MAFEVHVFSDSILKYLPARDELGEYSVSYRRFVQRGATVSSLMEQTVQRALDKRIHTRFKPEGVVLHVGTNSLHNYYNKEQHYPSDKVWTDILDDHVALIKLLLSSYPEETLIFVSGILPRNDSQELCALIDAYNQELARRVAAMSTRLTFMDWTYTFNPTYQHLFSCDGYHPSREGHTILHRKVTGFLLDHLSGCSHFREQQVCLMEAARMKLHLPKKISKKNKGKCNVAGVRKESTGTVCSAPKLIKETGGVWMSSNKGYRQSVKPAGQVEVQISDSVAVAISPGKFSANVRNTVSANVTPSPTYKPISKKSGKKQETTEEIHCPHCDKSFTSEMEMLDHFLLSHCSTFLPTGSSSSLPSPGSTQFVSKSTTAPPTPRYAGGPALPAIPHSTSDPNKTLSISQVMEIVSDRGLKISSTRAIKPKAGEVFVFDLQEINDDWKCDDYQWRQNGVKSLPKKDPVLKKIYFVMKSEEKESVGSKGSSAFTKCAYFPVLKPNVVIVQYNGDDSKYIPSSHGNRKYGEGEFRRTCPSVLNEIREEVGRSIPSEVYKRQVVKPVSGLDQGVLNARNLDQVANMKKRLDQQRRLGRDDINNLVELSYHLGNFVWNITLYPDLVVITGLKDNLDEFNKLLQLKLDSPLCIYYDTTFNLGDFYVTPITISHILFEETPSVPIAFMIHERKFQKHHELFLQTLKDVVPNLNKVLAFVTDREIGITNAVQNIWPQAKVLHCWNHIKRDVRFWLRKSSTEHKEIPVYMDHLDQLLQCKDEDHFSEVYGKISSNWSRPFLEYFDKSIKPNILKYAARWILEGIGMYNPFSGITNNISESMNKVLKELTAWKRQPVDCTVLSLWHLQRYFQLEISRGKAGIGKFHLHPHFMSCSIQPKDILCADTITPTNIVDFVRNSANKDFLISRVDANGVEDVRESEEEPKSEKLSQKALARTVLETNGVIHVPGAESFMVKGSNDARYAVTLFPRESCNCPSTTECYHIIAAKMSIGLMPRTQSEKINLTQMRRNSRKRQDKKSGTKKPRLYDYEPAPDSLNATLPDQSFNTSIGNTSTPGKYKSQLPLLFNGKQNDFMDDIVMVAPSPVTSILGKTPSKRPKKNVTFQASSRRKSCSKRLVMEDADLVSKKPKPTLWKAELGLSCNEKNEIENNDLISDIVMEAVNCVLKKQFSEINGLQPTTLSPIWKFEKYWDMTNTFQECESPSGQIHHTGRGHWVTSVSRISPKTNMEQVFMLDSLPSENSITTSLQLQFAKLYGFKKQDIHINIPVLQRQKGGKDCGLFAIAYLVEFCSGGLESVFDNKVSKWQFIQKDMCKHLMKCFQEESFTPFPKQQVKDEEVVVWTRKVELLCCGLPELYDDTICCDRCNSWFHKRCKSDTDTEGSWFCSEKCSQKRRRQPKTIPSV